MLTSTLLQQKLKNMPVWALSVYAALCSFAVYFCMYAFRKPFTAAGFTGIEFLNIDYKVWLVTAQVIGYMLSKFYGIKFISGMKGEKRAVTIVKLILLGRGLQYRGLARSKSTVFWTDGKRYRVIYARRCPSRPATAWPSARP